MSENKKRTVRVKDILKVIIGIMVICIFIVGCIQLISNYEWRKKDKPPITIQIAVSMTDMETHYPFEGNFLYTIPNDEEEQYIDSLHRTVTLTAYEGVNMYNLVASIEDDDQIDTDIHLYVTVKDGEILLAESVNRLSCAVTVEASTIYLNVGAFKRETMTEKRRVDYIYSFLFLL